MAFSLQKGSLKQLGAARAPARGSLVVSRAANSGRNLWAPGVVAPDYLNGELAGDYGAPAHLLRLAALSSCACSRPYLPA